MIKGIIKLAEELNARGVRIPLANTHGSDRAMNCGNLKEYLNVLGLFTGAVPKNMIDGEAIYTFKASPSIWFSSDSDVGAPESEGSTKGHFITTEDGVNGLTEVIGIENLMKHEKKTGRSFRELVGKAYNLRGEINGKVVLCCLESQVQNNELDYLVSKVREEFYPTASNLGNLYPQHSTVNSLCQSTLRGIAERVCKKLGMNGNETETIYQCLNTRYLPWGAHGSDEGRVEFFKREGIIEGNVLDYDAFRKVMHSLLIHNSKQISKLVHRVNRRIRQKYPTVEVMRDGRICEKYCGLSENYCHMNHYLIPPSLGPAERDILEYIWTKNKFIHEKCPYQLEHVVLTQAERGAS